MAVHGAGCRASPSPGVLPLFSLFKVIPSASSRPLWARAHAFHSSVGRPSSLWSSPQWSSTPPETSTSFPVLPLSAVDLSPRRRPPLLPWPSPARRTRPRLTPAGPLLVVASVLCRRQAARRDARGRLDVIPCSVRRPEAVPASPGPSCSCCAVSRAKAVWLSLLRAQSPTVVAPCFSGMCIPVVEEGDLLVYPLKYKLNKISNPCSDSLFLNLYILESKSCVCGTINFMCMW